MKRGKVFKSVARSKAPSPLSLCQRNPKPGGKTSVYGKSAT
jgi:hypothetical protein